jgi:hypothetical protein
VNLIEKLFGRKEQTSPEIEFDELSGWLTAKSDELSEGMDSRSTSIFLEIEKALKKIKKSAALLEGTVPEGRFHLKLVKIATSNRDNMVKQVKMLVENIKIPKTADTRGIIEFHGNAVQTLTVCLENMLKSYQYAKLVYIEESKQLISEVNSLGRLLNQLIEPVNQNKNVIDALDKASYTIQNIQKILSDIQVEKRVITEMDEKIKVLKKEIEDTQENLLHLKQSEQWRQYQNSMDKLAELDNEASNIESEINRLVLPLNKALNRLKQLSDRGRHTLAPNIREGLHLCLSDPKCVDPGFFVEFKKIMESDTLELASDKKYKMLEQVKLAQSSFEGRKIQYQTVLLDIETKKKELSLLEIKGDEKTLNDKMEAHKDWITTAEKELETSRKRLSALENNLELKKQELQQAVNSIDNRMRISF